MPNGYFHPRLSAHFLRHTHPRASYLFSWSRHYCHLNVFCFSSSNSVSISLTSSSFILLFSLSELFFITLLFVSRPIIVSSFLAAFKTHSTHTDMDRDTLSLLFTDTHTHQLSLSHFLALLVLFFCVRTQCKCTHSRHSSLPPSVQSESASSGLTSSQGRRGDMMKSPAENI